MRLTQNIQDCAKLYNTLLNKRYYITLENGIAFEFYFTRRGFAHLLGIHKLKDIPQFRNASNEKIFKDILSGKIKHNTLKISKFYNKISDRIEHFERIFDMLDITKSNKIIINFNKELVSDTKLDNTKFIFYKNESVGYSMLTIGKKLKEYYPETFFYEESNRYINEQILFDIVDIRVKYLK